MTENKRFTLHITWFNREKTEGEALLKDNGQPLLETERIDDARLLKNILNEKEDRIKQLEHQLHSLNGLWASDKEDMSYPFRLEFKELQE